MNARLVPLRHKARLTKRATARRRRIDIDGELERRAGNGHQKPRRNPVAAGITDDNRQPPILEGDEVVVVATDGVGGPVGKDELPVVQERREFRQEFTLKLPGHLEFVPNNDPIGELEENQKHQPGNADEVEECELSARGYGRIEVLQREQGKDDADSEEKPPGRRQSEGQPEKQDFRPVEETPDLAPGFVALVISGDNTKSMGGITIEQPTQIARTDSPGVIADKALGTLKPVVFRHLTHPLLRAQSTRVHAPQDTLNPGFSIPASGVHHEIPEISAPAQIRSVAIQVALSASARAPPSDCDPGHSSNSPAARSSVQDRR